MSEFSEFPVFMSIDVKSFFNKSSYGRWTFHIKYNGVNSIDVHFFYELEKLLIITMHYAKNNAIWRRYDLYIPQRS